MASQALLRLSSSHVIRHPTTSFFPSSRRGASFPKPRSALSPSDLVTGGGDGGSIGTGGSGGGGGRPDGPDFSGIFSPISVFVEGWRSRVSADPQFPFKVLTEEIVGVGACALGDMASRPGFGLGELDFVVSTLTVSAIANFMLMYLLAPTAATSVLPAHVFAPGAFSTATRLGTLISKGAAFAVVGFAAGLVGTGLSNGLVSARKRFDRGFENVNGPPPVLNALTWALHMGISSNLRYQALNGVEFLLGRAAIPAGVFGGSVIGLRCLNNVLGGVSFVAMARVTGAQARAEEQDQMKEKISAR